jgi:hypothetical protein
MKLVLEAVAAGVEFGGYSEEGPDKKAWPYTSGSKVYVPKARTDKVVAMSDFLFELNNAIRKPAFTKISEAASKKTIDAKEYARQTVEQEVEGMLRLGAIWFETRKSLTDSEWDKYDQEFYVQEYKDFQAGKTTKELIIKEVLQRVRHHEPHPEFTIEQFYMWQYQESYGGK